MSTKLLCQAIAAQAMVSFMHRGEQYTVEPCSVGYEERDERGRPLLLRAWHEDGWRDFEVKFMSRVEIGRQEPLVEGTSGRVEIRAERNTASGRTVLAWIWASAVSDTSTM
jgi:hypothetical protein